MPGKDYEGTQVTIADYKYPVAVQYEYTDSGQLHLLVRTPYNPTFIEAFKTLVHYPARRWDSDRKLWVILEGEYYADDIFDLIKQHFPNFEIGHVE